MLVAWFLFLVSEVSFHIMVKFPVFATLVSTSSIVMLSLQSVGPLGNLKLHVTFCKEFLAMGFGATWAVYGSCIGLVGAAMIFWLVSGFLTGFCVSRTLSR